LEPHDEAEARKEEDRIIRALAKYAPFLGEIKQDSGLASSNSSPPIDDPIQSVEPLDKRENIYPCLLAQLGSGTVYLQVRLQSKYA